MRSTFRSSLLLASAALIVALPVTAIHAQPAAAVAAAPTPVPALIAKVKIPHRKFVLANGLTVLVHEDRKAPVVGVAPQRS